ncbi:hypothetical protein SeMB42_g07282 [Synchytrium endobioticum]|nr:hypothetical protein SeMB42_g07282 [Synchytrium endobioticum]
MAVTLDHLRQLATDIRPGLASGAQLNNILKLLTIAETNEHTEIVSASLIYLDTIFRNLLPQLCGKSSSGAVKSSAELKSIHRVRDWMRDNFRLYMEILAVYMFGDKGRKTCALQILSWPLFVKAITLETELSSSTTSYNFPNDWMMKVVESILFIADGTHDLGPHLLDAIGTTANEMDDVRFYLYRDIGRCLTRYREKGVSKKELIDMTVLIQFLQSLKPLPESKTDDDGSLIREFNLLVPRCRDASNIPSVQQYKKEFSEAWLSLLRLPLTQEEHKLALSNLHLHVIPNMHEPVLLADYLSDLYSAGNADGGEGVLSVLALNGLFVLITRHNLDYPNFYKQLYGILTPQTFKFEHWSRFFRLLSLCLSSTHVPAYLIASFIKRLARISLSTQPNASMAIVALIYNLIKMHPSCVVLVHRDVKDGGGSALEDKYDYDEEDPSKSHALESSLWELHALKQHYCPDVVRLSTILETSLTKQPYDIEEFMHANGGTESSRNDKDAVLDLMRSDVAFGNVWRGWA